MEIALAKALEGLLFVCLNGQMYATEESISYYINTRTIGVKNAVPIDEPCPVQYYEIFKDGFD